jgi:hypothetical protein
MELDGHCFLEGGGWLLCSYNVCIKPCEFHLEVGFFYRFENQEVSHRSSTLESTECGKYLSHKFEIIFQVSKKTSNILILKKTQYLICHIITYKDHNFIANLYKWWCGNSPFCYIKRKESQSNMINGIFGKFFPINNKLKKIATFQGRKLWNYLQDFWRIWSNTHTLVH